MRRPCFFALILLGLSGCATIRAGEIRSTEEVLAAAGFERKPADTPAKASHLEALPTGKVLLRERMNGTRHYVYADTTVCKCLWVGTPAEYAQYEKLVAKQSAADKAAMVQNEASNPWDWALWGLWP